MQKYVSGLFESSNRLPALCSHLTKLVSDLNPPVGCLPHLLLVELTIEHLSGHLVRKQGFGRRERLELIFELPTNMNGVLVYADVGRAPLTIGRLGHLDEFLHEMQLLE